MRILCFCTPPKVTVRGDSKVGSPAKERLNLGSWGGEEVIGRRERREVRKVGMEGGVRRSWWGGDREAE